MSQDIRRGCDFAAHFLTRLGHGTCFLVASFRPTSIACKLVLYCTHGIHILQCVGVCLHTCRGSVWQASDFAMSCFTVSSATTFRYLGLSLQCSLLHAKARTHCATAFLVMLLCVSYPVSVASKLSVDTLIRVGMRRYDHVCPMSLSQGRVVWACTFMFVHCVTLDRGEAFPST